MDAAARRPSSPPLTAWLGFGFAVVTIVLALRLRRGAPTWAHPGAPPGSRSARTIVTTAKPNPIHAVRGGEDGRRAAASMLPP